MTDKIDYNNILFLKINYYNMIDNTNQTHTKQDGNKYDDANKISIPIMARTVTKPEWLDIKTDIPDKITSPILRRQNTIIYDEKSDIIYDISSNFRSGLQPPILRRQTTNMYDVSLNSISGLQPPILRRQTNIIQEHHCDHINTKNNLTDILDEHNNPKNEP